VDAGRKPRIGLVLGSGGARGLAQIGVIEVLEERGLEIVAIAGTSIGALVGGLHAAGKLGEYRDWMVGMDRNAMLRLLDPGWGRPSLFTGHRLLSALREVCGSPLIEDLSIDFTAVAVDLERHREVWLRQGDMWDAVRASFAIPGLFTPHVVNGRALVDGGLLAPLPLTAMRMSEADTVIAVDLNGPPRAQDQQAATETDGGTSAPPSRWWPLRHRTDPPADAGHGPRLGFIELMTLSLDTMQARIARVQLALDPPGVEIRIPRDASQFYEFWRAAELIALGREEAARALDAAGY
jgi:NTE family protein